MRQLQTNDVFRMSRIFKKMNIKASDVDLGTEQSKEGAPENADKKLAPENADKKLAPENADEKLALAVILKVVENLYLAQAEINEFLGDLAGMTADEFGKLPITETIRHIKEFKELDGIADFFARVGQWTKSL